MNIIESTTAVIHGWVNALYRSVTHLTPQERQAVRDGDLVYFRITPRTANQSGYKVVTQFRGRFDCHEPSAQEFEIIRANEQAKLFGAEPGPGD